MTGSGLLPCKLTARKTQHDEQHSQFPTGAWNGGDRHPRSWSIIDATPAANQTGSSIMTMKQDLADREKDIHWPEGFDPSRADLFSHNALLINASCERIWGHIIDAAKWPQWYPNSKDVHIDGGDVLKGGTVFHWLTFGLPLESSRFRLASAGSKARSA
jgi:hypothetical protein